MKRTCTLLFTLFLAALAFPAAAGVTITSTHLGDTLTVKTCDWDAQAICSVKRGGKEYIDDYDHGRQLQTAITFGQGEAYNPTEAGASYLTNGINPEPSKSINGSVTTGFTGANQWLHTSTKMAYWNPVNGVEVSNWFVDKHVTAIPGMYSNYLKYEVTVMAQTGVGEPTHSYGQFEFLTGYMPAEFSKFYTLDVKGTKALAAILPCPNYTTCSPEQPLPLIFATTDGNHAMGIYNRGLPQPNYAAAGVGRWQFTGPWTGQSVVKWNNVYRYNGSITAGTPYTYTGYVIVGNLNAVKLQMQYLYNVGL